MITTVYFDIGGVLGTNGWDHESRKRAVDHFGLDHDAFEKIHAQLAESLDTSTISVHDYVDQCLSASLQPTTTATPSKETTQADFLAFIKNESQPNPGSISLAAKLAASKKYYLATINNESRELNDYRVDKFAIGQYFKAFFSSGYMGVRKPDRLIYERALWISHRDPSESVFIDDREANLVVPREQGMKTILFVDADQLQVDLRALNLDLSA